jgi:hypothetical protein
MLPEPRDESLPNSTACWTVGSTLFLQPLECMPILRESEFASHALWQQTLIESTIGRCFAADVRRIRIENNADFNAIQLW